MSPERDDTGAYSVIFAIIALVILRSDDYLAPHIAAYQDLQDPFQHLLMHVHVLEYYQESFEVIHLVE